MNKKLFGLFLLVTPVLCFSQEHKSFVSNGVSINSVFSTHILETSKEFYFVTYLPQTTINLRYEFVFKPTEKSTPITIEPETGFVFLPIQYSDGDEFSGSEYQEKIHNLSFFTGIAASFTFKRISIGYNLKSSLSIIESKRINSFSNAEREWLKSDNNPTFKNLRFEQGFRFQFRGDKFLWGIYQYQTMGNWLDNRQTYYGNSFNGLSLGFSLGIVL